MLKILKGKYTDIKLAKGVWVDSKKYSYRDFAHTGISTEDYGKFWFHMPKGKAIFKSYDGYLKELKNLRIANELLCYELSKQMGIRCAIYELATINHKKTGVVTYQVNKQNQKLINSVELFKMLNRTQKQDIQGYEKLFDDLIKNGYQIDKQKALKDLFKISFFDSLTMQSDRNTTNIFFLVDETTKKIEVAPLIDNELAFNIQNIQKQLRENLDIDQRNFSNDLDYIYKMITIDNLIREDSMFKENIKQIVLKSFEDDEYAKVFKQFMKGFNVKKAINKVKDKGVKIGPRYEHFLLMAEDTIKELYRTEVTRYKMKHPDKQNDNDKTF